MIKNADDLELLDALVWARVITRETAHYVVENADESHEGRIASYIGERGLHSTHAYALTIITHIALGDVPSDAPGDPTLGGRLRDQYEEKPETD